MFLLESQGWSSRKGWRKSEETSGHFWFKFDLSVKPVRHFSVPVSPLNADVWIIRIPGTGWPGAFYHSLEWSRGFLVEWCWEIAAFLWLQWVTTTRGSPAFPWTTSNNILGKVGSSISISYHMGINPTTQLRWADTALRDLILGTESWCGVKKTNRNRLAIGSMSCVTSASSKQKRATPGSSKQKWPQPHIRIIKFSSSDFSTNDYETFNISPRKDKASTHSFLVQPLQRRIVDSGLISLKIVCSCGWMLWNNPSVHCVNYAVIGLMKLIGQ